jgi:Holliday junction resolvasome RuvABC endonuclease subunit
VLAFDPGSVTTGWCSLNKGEYHNSGYIRVSDKWEFERRREALREGVVKIIGECPLKIDVVVVEEPMSMHMGVAKKLATLKAMIEEIAYRFGLGYISVQPSEWHRLVRAYPLPKSFIGTIKDRSQFAAANLIGRPFPVGDEADAVWIARCAHAVVQV